MTDLATVDGLSQQTLQQAFANQTLFAEKTWQLSPHAFPLSKAQVREIQQIGKACHQFYLALEKLYTKSRTGKKILRNQNLVVPWVAEYLERGKPEALIQHSNHKEVAGKLPLIIRPDLLITEEGFALTEMDSVPGGIGLTAFLNRLYRDQGGILGEKDRMIHAFYQSLIQLCPDQPLPFIAIVVSHEAETYRPEMQWLAEELQKHGYRVFVFYPEQIMPLGDTLCADIDGDPQKIDILYRFYELFDLPNIPVTRHIPRLVEEEGLQLTPPMRPQQEEKLNLGLLHHHRLEEYWEENLDKENRQLLQKIVPSTWIMDNPELPPGAVFDGPWVNGKPIHDWEQLINASQKERNLILKISGYHETAWGARSVTLGSDSSRMVWGQAIQHALRSAGRNLHILQDFKKPKRIRHQNYTSEGEIRTYDSRVRLCPYFMIQSDEVELTGILATLCPADKKIIHGMKDATLLPCKLSN
jgi:hypothetical protein